MPLSTGTRLGPYELQSLVGVGGMGKVPVDGCRAPPRRRNQSPVPALSGDPDRLARFPREAQTLAALSHPNIAHIYGLVEAPVEGGAQVHALVMEWVDGEEIAQRLARGPIAVEEALAIARQIADALEAAHETGDHPSRPQAGQHQGRATTARSRCWTSVSRKRWIRRRGIRAPTRSIADGDVARHDGDGRHSRHGRLHGAGAGARTAGRSSAPTSGPSASSSSRCWPAGGCSTANRWPTSWLSVLTQADRSVAVAGRCAASGARTDRSAASNGIRSGGCATSARRASRWRPPAATGRRPVCGRPRQAIGSDRHCRARTGRSFSCRGSIAIGVSALIAAAIAARVASSMRSAGRSAGHGCCSRSVRRRTGVRRRIERRRGGHFAGWLHGRVHHADDRRPAALRPLARDGRGARHLRNRRSALSVLVPRQPVAGILRQQQAVDGLHRRRAARGGRRHRAGTRRHVDG